jgi:hypothetical protein
MAEARVDAEWNHTSAVLAMLANVNRDPKKHGPYHPEDFHPSKRRQHSSTGIPITRSNIGLLKKVFLKGGNA